MAGKEGESYLDQLLNNASTSSQEAGVEQVKENARKAELDNVGLQEALAVLNDLPDETDSGEGRSKRRVRRFKKFI